MASGGDRIRKRLLQHIKGKIAIEKPEKPCWDALSKRRRGRKKEGEWWATSPMKDLAWCRQGSGSQKSGPNASEPGRIWLCQAKLKWQLEQQSCADRFSHISQLPRRLSLRACRANLLTQMFGAARCHAYNRAPEFPLKGYPMIISCDSFISNYTDMEISHLYICPRCRFKF